MNPLDRILSWWEPLADFPREWVAVKVCCFLGIRDASARDFEAGFRELLSELLSLPQHLGRALAVRGVIDYYFTRERLDDAERHHMDLVETSDEPQLKTLANAALGRGLQSAAGRAHARDTWTALREAELSDSALAAWERDAMIRSIPQ